ncbi:TetR/AcrR family transcriptional regulator [Sphingomonas sp. dw_22]|uniref:TetR/AcrR family transcriptional regulator n=1 Tax=Sphingomonas sp. dw_22 TaxID=2721175 RepID=UPI00211635A5|nr:TetR/AcrR family transcriptional regulator [Sphingomonas sp. dw_22]
MCIAEPFFCCGAAYGSDQYHFCDNGGFVFSHRLCDRIRGREAITDNRRPRQDRSRKTFDLLLDAAGHVLEQEGIDRISTNLVCQRAGVTPPALYRYFDDKYAIIEALAERLMARQNVALDAWVARYRGAGLEMVADKVIELLREMDAITSAQPGALWIMRALRAVPKLAPIRLASHNYVADVLTDLYMPFLPQVPREVVRLRTRIAVEMAYSIDEMLKEEAVNRELVFDEADKVFRSMFDYPEYGVRITGK